MTDHECLTELRTDEHGEADGAGACRSVNRAIVHTVVATAHGRDGPHRDVGETLCQ